MPHRLRAWLVALLVLAMALAGFGAGLLAAGGVERDGGAGGQRESRDGLQEIRDAYEEILSSSVEPPSEEDLVQGAVSGMRRVGGSGGEVTESELVAGAIRGMVRVLKGNEDPYASFYSPQAYRSFQEYTSGEFSGIGVMLRPDGRVLEIVSVLDDTPAQAEGIHEGDVIETVEGETVDGLSLEETIARIKGPEGTDVTLEVERDGQVIEFTITRAEIALPNVRARILRSGDGYLRLFGFGKGAGDQLREKAQMLIDKGAEGLILDLRDNGGGLFVEGIEVASTFIEDGVIVTYKEKGGTEVDYEAEGDAFEDIPLVVLVNRGTASASEIVAGALQDHGRAVLVGTRTFGKGSVQEVVPLADSSALKITTAAYYTPDGRDIDGGGIVPDIQIDAGPYEQLRHALEALATGASDAD